MERAFDHDEKRDLKNGCNMRNLHAPNPGHYTIHIYYCTIQAFQTPGCFLYNIKNFLRSNAKPYAFQTGPSIINRRAFRLHSVAVLAPAGHPAEGWEL